VHRGERSHRENSIDLSHGLREKETELLDGNGRRDCTDKSGRGGRERERVSREEWERTGGGGRSDRTMERMGHSECEREREMVLEWMTNKSPNHRSSLKR
jgi:hypothetical protein